MRRLTFTLFLMLATAGVLAAAGAAKEGHVEVAAPFGDVRSGGVWYANIVLNYEPKVLAGVKPPTLTIRNVETGKTLGFAASGAEGRYTARVVFPEAGSWTYAVVDPVSGREYGFDPVDVAPAVAAEPSRPASAGDGFPLWPLLGAMGLLTALGIALIVRRERLATP